LGVPQTVFFVVNHRGKAEVSDFQVHALSQKQVAELEVSVDYVIVVHVRYPLHQLLDVEPSFDFVESLASFEQVGERLVVADVQQHVDVVFVLEIPVEPDHVLVLQRAVDFNLTGEFLTGFALCEPGFRYHLEGPSLSLVFKSFDRRNPRNFICFREASLAKEASFFVSDDLLLQSIFVSVVFRGLRFFFDNLN
jgi:hypothetical protein